MNYIINPWVFYLISVSDILGRLARLSMFIFGMSALILFVTVICDKREEYKRPMKICTIIFAISILFCVFIPSEETCYKMLAADMLTKENINAASDYVTDVIDYAVDKVKDLNNGN